jgi:hypothetical protein
MHDHTHVYTIAVDLQKHLHLTMRAVNDLLVRKALAIAAAPSFPISLSTQDNITCMRAPSQIQYYTLKKQQSLLDAWAHTVYKTVLTTKIEGGQRCAVSKNFSRRQVRR